MITLTAEDFHGEAKPLGPSDAKLIAGYLGCEVAAMQAVLEVEARGEGFDSKGRPKMLFEPHVFWRELGNTKLRAQAESLGLAYEKWGERPYPEDSYPRLLLAMGINETAALRSASWGMGQVMAFNHELLGFESPQEFVMAMTYAESAHLYAMGRFIVGKGIQKYLREKNWALFAKIYNGSEYAKHGYHTKLAAAYARRPKAEYYVPSPTSMTALMAMLGPAGRNYRGRFEEGQIDMGATDRRSNKMSWFTHYNKFWIAMAGFAITAVTQFTGIDVAALGINAQSIVTFVTAVLVYAVPNTNYDTNASGEQT